MKSDFAGAMCEFFLNRTDGLTNAEMTVIDRCVRKMYEPLFENQTAEMPIMDDFIKILLEQPEHEAQEIGGQLERVMIVYPMLKKRTNVELDNRVIAFDIREVPKKLDILTVQNIMWNRIFENHLITRRTYCYVHEFHNVMDSELTRMYFIEVLKRSRTFGGILTWLTNDIDMVVSFKRHWELGDVFDRFDFLCILARDEWARECAMKAVGLVSIDNWQDGDGLIYFSNKTVPFVHPLYFGLNKTVTNRIITDRHDYNGFIFGTPGQGRQFTVQNKRLAVGVTSEEAEKYLINDYDPFTYQSEAAFNIVNKQLRDYLKDYGLGKSTAKVSCDDFNQWLYALKRTEYESEMLFNRAVIKFGIPLWSGDAWRTEKCHDMCPLGTLWGDGCNKKLLDICDSKRCFGQLLMIACFLDETDSDRYDEVWSDEGYKMFDSLRDNFIESGIYKTFFPGYEVKQIEGYNCNVPFKTGNNNALYNEMFKKLKSIDYTNWCDEDEDDEF